MRVCTCTISAIMEGWLVVGSLFSQTITLSHTHLQENVFICMHACHPTSEDAGVVFAHSTFYSREKLFPFSRRLFSICSSFYSLQIRNV